MFYVILFEEDVLCHLFIPNNGSYNWTKGAINNFFFFYNNEQI